MPNYYEMLQVEPTASTAEIQAAFDQSYNKWRRLVNHHDPNVVNQANQALQLLQQIQATLTDSARRAAYDAGIGLGGAVGGLADPEAILKGNPVAMTPPPPPRSSQPSPPVPTPPAPTLWACPKCGATNPEYTQFCFKCGTQLVRDCPECRKNSSLVATGFCGNCGYKYEIAARRRELTGITESLKKQLSAVNRQLSQAQQQKVGGMPGVGIGVGLILLSCLAAGGSNSLANTLALLGLGGGLGGIILFVSVLVIFNGNSRKHAQIANLTTASQDNARQLQAAEQEYKGLSLRKM